MSWGFGGLFLMDGHTVSKTTRELTPTDDTLDFTVFLARGEHVMEAYGGENSGDEPTTWCLPITQSSQLQILIGENVLHLVNQISIT